MKCSHPSHSWSAVSAYIGRLSIQAWSENWKGTIYIKLESLFSKQNQWPRININSHCMWNLRGRYRSGLFKSINHPTSKSRRLAPRGRACLGVATSSRTTGLYSLWGRVHTKIDLSWIDLSWIFEKVFTLIKIDLGSISVRRIWAFTFRSLWT